MSEFVLFSWIIYHFSPMWTKKHFVHTKIFLCEHLCGLIHTRFFSKYFIQRYNFLRPDIKIVTVFIKTG